MGHPGKTAGLLFILVRMIAFQSAKPLIRQADHQLFHSSVKILGSGDPHAFYLYGMSQDWDPLISDIASEDEKGSFFTALARLLSRNRPGLKASR